MTKSAHNPQSPDGQKLYEVGFKKPPIHSQFKPGHGLSRGRPKGQRNVATVLRKALNERTKVKEGNRTRSVTKLDAMILKMIADAHTNPKVQANLISLMRAVGMIEIPDEPKPQDALTVDDEMLIADYFKRNGDRLAIEQPADAKASAHRPGNISDKGGQK